MILSDALIIPVSHASYTASDDDTN